MANPFFFKNYNDCNFQYQINKLKIWSFILNLYTSNRLQLKRLSGLARNRSSIGNRCARCTGQLHKCTCQLIEDLLQQISTYIKAIFGDEKSQKPVKSIR